MPSKFNVAKVVPIYKYGQRDDIRNCFPVSIPPVFSNILKELSPTEYFFFNVMFVANISLD